MISVENVDTFGWRGAIRGMRNPMNSWDKSDSSFIANGEFYDILGSGGPASPNEKDGDMVLGSNDLELMKKLITAGTEHRKFLRMIHVQMDVVAPLYWWKEYDTYKVGTVANSCSTMHKLTAKPFELNDFSWDQPLNTGCDLFELKWETDCSTIVQPQRFLIEYIIPVLNICREKYLETKYKKYWLLMIQLLPSSYNQRRTIDINYEVALNIIRQRTGHKLDEWHVFIDELMKLPYMKEFVKCLS